VVQIMDYGKYKYQQQKKNQELKKKQIKNVLKEIKITPRIEDNDLMTKLNITKKLLEENCNVKISMRFRGRENINKSNGVKILEHFKSIESCNSSEIKQDSDTFYLFLSKGKI